MAKAEAQDIESVVVSRPSPHVALLRIADALDRTHTAVVSSLQIKVGKSRVKLGIIGRGDPELEIWAARRKMDLFTETFDRTLSFKRVKK